MFFRNRNQQLAKVIKDYEQRIDLLRSTNDVLSHRIRNFERERAVVAEHLNKNGFEVKPHYAQLGNGYRELVNVEVVKVEDPIESISNKVKEAICESAAIKKDMAGLSLMYDNLKKEAKQAVMEVVGAIKEAETDKVSLRERCAQMVYGSPSAALGIRGVTDVQELYDWITGTKKESDQKDAA